MTNGSCGGSDITRFVAFWWQYFETVTLGDFLALLWQYCDSVTFGRQVSLFWQYLGTVTVK